MSNQQIGSLIISHIITAFGAGILYGLYHLAGDYLTTFFFMVSWELIYLDNICCSFNKY